MSLKGGLPAQKREIERGTFKQENQTRKVLLVKYVTRSRRQSLLLLVAGVLGGMGVGGK